MPLLVYGGSFSKAGSFSIAIAVLPTEAQTLSGNYPQGQLSGQLSSGPPAILTDGHQV